jgi:hypothetical protein
MTNEVGQQKTMDPTQVTNVMKKIVDLGIPYAVWFSIDIQGYGGATSLTDTNGTLRPNGQAYADFIKNDLQVTAKIPGDVNSDSKVDISDYNIIVANFSRPYTIFDYNLLVANFSRSN